ncbi:MAG: serine hydrolase [Burkholderiaceae bacterium]
MKSRRRLLLAGAAAALGAGCGAPRADVAPRPRVVEVVGATPFEWPTGAPESQGLSATALADVLRDGAELPGLRSLLVARHGVLVGERYYAGASAADLLAVNSVTKSVSSMLVGLALHKGAIASLNEPVARLIPEAAAHAPGSALASVTLEQILGGQTGQVFALTRGRELVTAPDLAQFVLELPAQAAVPPGWTYNDAAVALIAPILARAQGLDLAALAARDLFAPLGIERFNWVRDRQGQATAFGGLALRTRDLLKLACLMLDGGQWRGAAVLPAAWVAESTQARVPATWRVPPVDNIGYGRLWFTGTLHGRRVVWGWGYGGQFALWAPELRLTVATAASSPQPVALKGQTDAVMALVGRVVQAAV